MVGKVLIYLAKFVLIDSAFATVGSYLPQDQNPPYSCAILYVNNLEEKKIIGLCTGDIISGDQIATAGHCEQGNSNLPTYVKCPGGVLRQVSHRETHPQFTGSGSRYDHSILTVSEKFGIDPVKVPEKEQIAALLKLNNCTISGYGLNNENKAGRMNTVKIDLNGNGPTFGPGVIGLTGNSLPRPGDSGSGLICRDASGTPFRVATVSQAEIGIANVASVDGALDWIKKQTAGHSGAEPETIASVSKKLDGTCAATGDCLQILGNAKNLPTDVGKALGVLQAKYAKEMEGKLNLKISSDNHVTVPSSNDQADLSLILKVKDITARFERLLAECKRLSNPKNLVERLEAEKTFDYSKTAEYEQCVTRLSYAAGALGEALQSTIDRQCGPKPKYPEPNADEQRALNLAAETISKVDFPNATDAQIEDIGQNACAKIKDPHLVNLCAQKFKSNVLTSYSCDSTSSWSLSSQNRAVAKVCSFGVSAAQAVDLKSAKSVGEARTAVEKQVESQCSRYKNQAAIRLCSSGGFGAVSSKFTGCSGIASVITSDDFQGRWNGQTTVSTAFPCSSGEYGVDGFGYKVEMTAGGAVVALGSVRLSNGKLVYPRFSGADDLRGMKSFGRESADCHEVELQADQIICRLGSAVMTYKIPKNPDAIPADDQQPPQHSDGDSRAYSACVRRLSIGAAYDLSGWLKEHLEETISQQCGSRGAE